MHGSIYCDLLQPFIGQQLSALASGTQASTPLICTQEWPSPSIPSPPPPPNNNTHTHTHTHNLPNKKNSLCFVARESQVRHWPWGSWRMFARWHLSHLPCNGCWPVSISYINCKYDWRTSPLVSFQFVPLLMQNWSQPFSEVLQTLPGTCSVS